ncbi:MAG TPA: metallophosphoesterase [Solirubrobacteraceae bacterium]
MTHELPAPAGSPPYRLRLDEVLAPAALRAVERAGVLRFHCVGDTGGFHNPIPQRAVAAAMATELDGEAAVSFFYHLGDIVYLNGERANYGAQFFDAYESYDAPIVAVAGNHDGDLPADSDATPLEAFTEQFCSGERRPWHPPGRARQRQPNVFWTLEHEWVTIIGLYTGVPEGGTLGREQLGWLVGELRDARRAVTLILAMHHPVFSVDRVHGSNLDLRDALDRCFAEAGRVPDAVFSAHAHNYQRYSRAHAGRLIPYVVAGGGGFPELHGLGYGVPDLPASFAGLPDVMLETYQHQAFGFMTVSCNPDGATVAYNTVVRRRPVLFDSFMVSPAS